MNAAKVQTIQLDASCILKCLPFTTQDTTRKALMGVHVEGPWYVATDGHCMLAAKSEMDKGTWPDKPLDLIFPKNAGAMLKRFVNKNVPDGCLYLPDSGRVDLAVTRETFHVEGTDSDFPGWRPFFDREYNETLPGLSINPALLAKFPESRQGVVMRFTTIKLKEGSMPGVCLVLPGSRGEQWAGVVMPLREDHKDNSEAFALVKEIRDDYKKQGSPDAIKAAK